jgi:hypothetical protein
MCCRFSLLTSLELFLLGKVLSFEVIDLDDYIYIACIRGGSDTRRGHRTHCPEYLQVL